MSRKDHSRPPAHILPVQASIAGFAGQPCTLQSLYDRDSGTLLIHKIVGFEATRMARNVLFVTTSARLPDYDSLFSAEELGHAIEAFESLKGRLTFAPEAQRCNPTGAIEYAEMTETGPKRRISDEISNEKIACLASC